MMVKVRRNILTLCILCYTLVACAQTTTEEGLQRLRQWQAGTTVSDEAVKEYGPDRCFAAEEIPDNVWQRMQGKTYTENPHIKRSDLRHIRVLHWDYDNQTHIGEMICNKKIASDLVEIFKELYAAHYPIQRMVLPDEYDADDERQMRANNSSCFCYRNIAGSKTLSKHALGMAVDLNTLYNPYVKRRKDGTLFVQPANATKYCNRKATFPYKITKDDLAYKLFTKHGFRWGGSWPKYKDYQHFDR